MEKVTSPAPMTPSPQQTGVVADPVATWTSPGSSPVIWGGSLAAVDQVDGSTPLPLGTPARAEDEPHSHAQPGAVSTPLPAPGDGWAKSPAGPDGENSWLGQPKGIVK
jgi:hypothetical protein